MRGLIIAITFITRIPLSCPNDVTQEEFAKSQHYYPLVGLILGGILCGVTYLLSPWYPPMILGAFALILHIFLTGGIHLDGFMDSMDGLLSARDPERMLEIMKDSRVGAYGAISIILLLLLKYTLFVEIINLNNPTALLLLLFMPMISRWINLIGIRFYPYARANGLGKGFHETSLQTKGIFLGEGLVILSLTAYFLSWAGVIGFVVAAGFVLIFTSKVSRLLGGLTGDLYGATIEISELFFLLAAFPFIQYFLF